MDKIILTPEQRKKISEQRKAYIKANPGKGNWTNYGKKSESYAEAMFKKALIQCGVSVVQYYIPPESDRCFELDFAIPDKKVAFEVNGNQHYENGVLKPYYQNRHNHFNDLGWTVHEIQYYEALKLERAVKVIEKAMDGSGIEYNTDPKIISYKDVKREVKEAQAILEENIETLVANNNLFWLIYTGEMNYSVYKGFTYWTRSSKCSERLHFRKAERPIKEELFKMVWAESTIKVAKKFGVTDKAIQRWCDDYQIKKPPRGYWAKVYKGNYPKDEK